MSRSSFAKAVPLFVCLNGASTFVQSAYAKAKFDCITILVGLFLSSATFSDLHIPTQVKYLP